MLFNLKYALMIVMPRLDAGMVLTKPRVKVGVVVLTCVICTDTFTSRSPRISTPSARHFTLFNVTPPLRRRSASLIHLTPLSLRIPLEIHLSTTSH